MSTSRSIDVSKTAPEAGAASSPLPEQEVRVPRRTYRVVPVPYWKDNPYLDLFYGALEPAGVKVVSLPFYSARILLAARDRVDAVHFHWPEGVWKGGKVDMVLGMARFLALLSAARWAGCRVLWTAHNLTPHEGNVAVSRIGLRALARASDLIICHDASAHGEIRRRFGSGPRVVVMPHGSYAGHFPVPAPRASVLAALGLNPALPVVSCIGALRDYKGIEVACDAAARLGGAVQLLVAGSSHRTHDLAALTRRMDTVPGARLVARFLSEQEIADVTAASDLVLLPYHKITGSGALLMAWTHGRAVVASDLPYFRELVPPSGGAGWLFEAGDPDALSAAIREALAVPDHIRSQAAYAEAAKYEWATCVAPVARVLSEWQQGKSLRRKKR